MIGRCDTCGTVMFRRSLHWTEGWHRLTSYIRRYGPQDADRPPLDPELAEVVCRAGGMGAFRRGEKNRWDFKRVWEETT